MDSVTFPRAAARLRGLLTDNRAYIISLASFVAKGGCALLITYWLARGLSVTDYAAWATMSSVGMILSVADFGAGQLVLTGIHERRRHGTSADGLLSNAVASMLLLSAALLVVGSFVLRRFDVLRGVHGQLLLLLVILPRIVLIPFGAVLSAHDRYHERKVFEAFSYAFAAMFVYVCLRRQANFTTMLIGVNVLISMGSAAVAVRARSITADAVSWGEVRWARVIEVLRLSTPYFVNNVSGLAIYGGFIALSAIVLDGPATAKLALLHSLIFMHLFQVFELLFRTSQTQLDDPHVIRRLRGLIAAGFLTTAVATLIGGSWAFRRFFVAYSYTTTELLAFVAFTFAEVYYLLLTSRMQMSSALRGKLRTVSVIKTAGFVAVLLLVSLSATPTRLLSYNLALLTYSVITSLWATLVIRERPMLRAA
jgi:uncharacterized membrane protein YjfL (UPF0719 family)